MSIDDFLRNFKETERLRQDAAKRAEDDEAARVRLNGEKIAGNLNQIVLPRLTEAAQKIKQSGYYAEVEKSQFMSGGFAFSLILKAAQRPLDDDSLFRLEYGSADAVIKARIRNPMPSALRFTELGLFPIDAITGADVDSHIETVLKLAFR